MAFEVGYVRSAARLQMRLFQANLERNQLILRLALSERRAKEMQALDDKYDGSRGAALQADIERRSTEKEEIAGHAENVAQALRWVEDIKNTALSLKDYASVGSAAAWDDALADLRRSAGSYVMDNDNLIGNTGQGRWPIHHEIVGGLGSDTTVKTAYLGADYVIELTDGTVLKPDLAAGTLSGGGLSFETGTLTVTARAGANADIVTFQDSLGNSYSGTIRTPRGYSITLDSGEQLVANTTTDRLVGGGLDLDMNALILVQRRTFTTDPVGTAVQDAKVEFSDGATTYRGYLDFDGPALTGAWLYNNFATAADKDRAAADAGMMLRYTTQVERELYGMEASLEVTLNKYSAVMGDMTDEWNQVMDEEMEAKNAELKAIMTRMALTEQAFALAGTYSADLIEGMFHSEPAWTQQKGVFGIINQTPDYS